jgi:Secretion system C-terminal sorting domain
VYRFNNTTPAYTGSIQLNYTDGAELNGIAENALTLNIHNGLGWNAYPATTRDGVNNFILTDGLSNVNLNEFTLADVQNALPLTWLSFNATPKKETVLLQWATAQEINTKNFTIQHSSNGSNWQAIGSIPAAGISSNTNNYSYIHTAPVIGKNYYRILQKDIDNKFSYSDVRVVLFNNTNIPYLLLGNPVTNGILTLQVNTPASLLLYAVDGKLVYKAAANAGIKNIDVSKLAKGMYLLHIGTATEKIIIQ